MKILNTLFLANAAAGGNNMMLILMFIVIAAFMYFGMIRPQKKQQQKRMQMMNQLKKGDKVVLVDGLHGKIDSINTKDRTVVIDADGIYLTFSKMAIRQIIPADVASEETSTKSEPKTDKTSKQLEDSKTSSNDVKNESTSK